MRAFDLVGRNKCKMKMTKKQDIHGNSLANRTKVLYICDVASPIFLNFIEGVARDDEFEIHILSNRKTVSADLRNNLLNYSNVLLHNIQVEEAKKSKIRAGKCFKNEAKAIILNRKYLQKIYLHTKIILGILNAKRKAAKNHRLICKINPDIVHALRIPFEGILAYYLLADNDIPLLISVWGNDFTLYSPRNIYLKNIMENMLKRCQGLHPDCYRDLYYAKKLKFNDDKPYVVCPGNGGIKTSIFKYRYGEEKDCMAQKIFGFTKIVLCPRGIRYYILTKSLFKILVDDVFDKLKIKFIFIGLAGIKMAEKWKNKYDKYNVAVFMPHQTQKQMSLINQCSKVMVSPSLHDGTPNCLLEAMATGTLPVMGNIPSIREWIVNGENGILFDNNNLKEMSSSIIRGIEDDSLQKNAAEINIKLIRGRAEYNNNISKIKNIYKGLIWNRSIE